MQKKDAPPEDPQRPVRRMVPLTLELINEGDFLREAQHALGKIQETLIHHAAEYRGDAKGAKAVLTIKVTLKNESTGGRPDERAFSIKGETSASVPGPPATVTLAKHADDEEGPRLFVRRTGSSESHPAQGILATQDGRTVPPTD